MIFIGKYLKQSFEALVWPSPLFESLRFVSINAIKEKLFVYCLW